MIETAGIAQVVASNLCVGCGACTVVAPDVITMSLTKEGTYLPVARFADGLEAVDKGIMESASKVCPFSDHADNEDVIGVRHFSDTRHSDVTGYYRKIVAGHVVSGDFREKGTSGGMTSWVLFELLRRGEIDGVIHVGSTFDELPAALSTYRISRTPEELFQGRKSRYHVQTLEDVLGQVKQEPGRYAVVGVPCFIKAVRLLTEADPTLNERIAFTLSLVCGHYKSVLYSEYLAWSSGVDSGAVKDIDYRHKEPSRAPNRYCVRISNRDGTETIRGVESIPMADWGLGVFKLGACDYCDDIVGETADMTCGDAWLPPFMGDWKGANMAIARSPLAEKILEEGESEGMLDVIPWTAEDVAMAQAGAVRHRREGLAARLGQRVYEGDWVPKKRVDPLPAESLSSSQAVRMLNRERISAASTPAYLEARQNGDISLFIEAMSPLVSIYDGSRRSTVVRRALARTLAAMPPKVESSIRHLLKGVRFS